MTERDAASGRACVRAGKPYDAIEPKGYCGRAQLDIEAQGGAIWIEDASPGAVFLPPARHRAIAAFFLLTGWIHVYSSDKVAHKSDLTGR
jgi:hypothetical protein